MTTGDGVLVSVTELARLKGVSQPAISKRLKRLVQDGLVTAQSRAGRTFINLAEWDSVTREFTDPAKLVALETVAAKKAGGIEHLDNEPIKPAGYSELKKGSPYHHELTRKARYDADLREIELKRLQQHLRTVDDIQAAATKVGETLVRQIEQLPSFADDIATAFGRGGVAAVRDLLKSKARGMRESVVRSLEALAAGADDGPADEQEPS